MEQVENVMAIDRWWDEEEYRVPSRARMKRERQAYEEAERGLENEGSDSSNHPGAC